MHIELILDLSEITDFYGDIPETLNAPSWSFERYELCFDPNEHADAFDYDFVEPVDRLCGALIDRGEVDYLTASQCKILVPWLEERLKRPCPHPLNALYPKLLVFARKAAELGTGVVVDL